MLSSGGRTASLRLAPKLAIVAIAALVLQHSAIAQAFSYRVEITAPEPLAKQLRTNLDIERWSHHADVTEGQFEQLFHSAPDQIREILATDGYFSPEVDATLEPGTTPTARFTIRPGEPTRIAKIDFKVTGAVTQDAQGAARIEDARRTFAIKAGDIFRQASWTATKDAAVHSLTRLRYPTAHIVSSRVQVDPVARSADVALEIDSGMAFVFGGLRVVGLKRYPKHIVENLNSIRRDDVYDEDALIKFQRRLLATGYFASAIVTTRVEGRTSGRTPVVVNIVEAASQHVEVGVGVSTDRGPRGQLDYRDNNFFNRAWKLSAGLYVDRLSQSVSTGLQFPRMENGWHYGLEAKFKNEDIQGQRITSWSTTGLHTYTTEEYESSQALQFLTERSALNDGTSDNRQALFLNQSWTWNGLDDLINPRRGYLANLQLGGASASLLSTRSFGRVYGRINYLQPLGPQWTLGLRAETGVVLAENREGIPSAYVFRTGGDTTIRGYAFESLGVKQGEAVVGGRYLVIGSVELTRWITPQWGGAVFYDVGNAFDDLHEFDPVSGYGVGARWRSPIGNLSLDLAYGQADGGFHVHFSAGYAFR
ncbi:MAG: BamA/TamA family outer membrane protein [Betaproteobacteria bacterium]